MYGNNFEHEKKIMSFEKTTSKNKLAFSVWSFHCVSRKIIKTNSLIVSSFDITLKSVHWGTLSNEYPQAT